MDFRGTTLTDRTIAWEDIVKVKEDVDGNILEYSGFIPEIALYLASQMNFTLDVQIQEDADYGLLRPNGTWSGCIGSLHFREADLATPGLSRDVSRQTVVDFTTPILNDKMTLYRLIGSQNQFNYWAYVNGVQLELWITIGAMLLLSSFCLWSLDRTKAEDAIGFVGLNLLQREYSSLIGTHLQATRMLMLVISFFCLTIFIFYSAVFTSTMTSLPKIPPLRSFQVRFSNKFQIYGVTG